MGHPEPGYALLVRFRLRPGAEAAFDTLVARTVALITEREPGTLAYTVHLTGDRAERVFYELYRDHAAFDDHERQPHTRYFLAARGALLTGDPEVTILTPTSSSLTRDGSPPR